MLEGTLIKELSQNPSFNKTPNDGAFVFNDSWNKQVSSHMTPEEELQFGMSLGLEKYRNIKKDGTPAQAMDAMRNPQQFQTNVIRHAFERLIDPKFIPDLYNMLHKNFDKREYEPPLSNQEIMDFVMKNLPPEVLTMMKELMKEHKAFCKEKGIGEKTAENEVFNLILFQLVNTQIVNYSAKVNNAGNPNATPEQKRLNSIMPKLLKNVYTDHNEGFIYDKEGKLSVENTKKPPSQSYVKAIIEKLNTAPDVEPIDIKQQQAIAKKVEVAREKALFGPSLMFDPEFADNYQSTDKDNLNKAFKAVMDFYTGGVLYNDPIGQKERFKLMINHFADLECPTALKLRGELQLGNTAELKNQLGLIGEAPDLGFPVNKVKGLQDLSKIEVFDNFRVNDYAPRIAFSLWEPEQKQAVDKQINAVSNFINSIDVRGQYNANDKYQKPEKGDIKGQLGFLAHQKATDPKRDQQIKLLQDIISDKSLTDAQKLPILQGAIDGLRKQIGKTMFESRLSKTLDNIEKGIEDAQITATGKKEPVVAQNNTKAFTEYLDKHKGSFDTKFVADLAKKIEPPSDTKGRKMQK